MRIRETHGWMACRLCVWVVEWMDVGVSRSMGTRGRTVGVLKFASLPCLNGSDNAIDLLETLVKRELGGWV